MVVNRASCRMTNVGLIGPYDAWSGDMPRGSVVLGQKYEIRPLQSHELNRMCGLHT
jgi:hypothetical protein